MGILPGGTPWLLHVGCAAIYLTMAVVVLTRGPRATVNRTCALLILCFTFWCACLAVSHFPHVDRARAIRAYQIGSFAWGSFASLAALFVASFVRPALLRSVPFLAALAVPACGSVWAAWTGRLALGYEERAWGWAFIWRQSLASTLFISYYGVFMVGGLFLLVTSVRRERSPVRRRQARIIFGAALPPLVFGTLTDVALPQLGYTSVPNLAPDFTIIWIVALAYSIGRYRTLELAPAVAADRLVETMSEALLLIDPDQRIVSANSAAVRLFGHAQAALRGMALADLLRAPTVLPPASDAANDKEPERHELTYVRPNGSPVEIDYAMSEIRGNLGERIGWVCVATNVTMRKRVEQHLLQARDALESRIAERTAELQALNARLVTEIADRKRSEEQIRLLIESMHEGVWVMGPDDRTVMGNSHLGQLLGVPPEKMVGRTILDFVDPASRDAFKEAIEASHRSEATRRDLRLRCAHGRPLMASVQVSPLPPTAEGAYAGAVLTLMDVTEREKMQAQLARSQRLASIGLLAAGVGHEINNPLTYVILNLDRLLSLAEGPPSEALRAEGVELVRDSLEGAHRMQDIVKDLRRFSRGESRPLSEVDVHEALEAAIKLSHNEVRMRARLEREYAADLPRVIANPGNLAQVFLNLIVNAAHAIPEGKPAENTIRVRTSRSDAEVTIEFADTGKGITPEDVEHIFEPFFTTKGGGSESVGLGLAICHETVTSLGGRMFVGSDVGRGSRFLVALKAGTTAGAPLSAIADARETTAQGRITGAMATVAATASDAVAAASDAPPCRVLVVDDEPAVARTLRQLFERHFQVTCALSGNEACTIITDDAAFDVVLCDLQMSGMSGMALAEWIEERAPTLRKRVVFMTGGAFTPDAERLVAVSTDRILEKPFSPAEALAAVRDTIARLGPARSTGARPA